DLAGQRGVGHLPHCAGRLEPAGQQAHGLLTPVPRKPWRFSGPVTATACLHELFRGWRLRIETPQPRHAVIRGWWSWSVDHLFHQFSFSIFVPFNETPATRPALVITKAMTGSPRVVLSMRPLAPMLATATVASAPTVQPLL